MALAQDFITACERLKGKPYVWGKKGPDSYDCSGLVSKGLRDVGIAYPDGSWNQLAATVACTVEEGIATPGALLYRPGHIAVSRGDGTTIEARNANDGIGIFSATGRGWTKAGIVPGITQQKGSGMARMSSPVKGTVSSGYGRRTLKGKTALHAGLDIAAPAGSTVRAIFAGTVERVVSGRRPGQSSTSGTVLAPARSGNGVIVKNADGNRQLYGHVAPSVLVGQSVSIGDALGAIDLSGITTGPHVHLEIWANASHTSHRDPMIDFRAFGVTPGSEPVKATSVAPNPPAPSADGPSAAVKSRLGRMGLPQTIAGVKRYQEHHGLYPDGSWGAVTDRYYSWVVALQTYLNTWKNVQRHGRLVVDGYRGGKTTAAEGYARAGATKSTPYTPPKEPAKRA